MSTTRGAIITRLSDVKPRRVEWLWRNRIALGKISMLAGDFDLGKTLVTLDIAARVSRGTPWPDCQDEPNPAGGVVLISAEDDVEDTIRPRLDAAGADCDRIVVLQGVRNTINALKPGGERLCMERTFSLADMPALDDAVRQCPDCRLVIVDPISAYLAGVDSHKNADVRGILAPLAKLAARQQVAIVCVSHLSKAVGVKAGYRVSGSGAFVAACRASWLVVPDTESEQLGRRLMTRMKNNLSPVRTGLAYTIISGGGPFSAPIICWDPNPVSMSADEALKACEAGRAKPATDEAKQWLLDTLQNGERVLAATIRQRGKADGLSWRTMQGAKRALSVLSLKNEFDGKWYWRLPPTEGAHDTNRLRPSTGAIKNAEERNEAKGASRGVVAPFVVTAPFGEIESKTPLCSKSATGTGRDAGVPGIQAAPDTDFDYDEAAEREAIRAEGCGGEVQPGGELPDVVFDADTGEIVGAVGELA